MEGPKFEIGQKIKFINDPDSKAGEVVGISCNAEGWFYSIKSKTVDMAKEELVEGIKSGAEDEFIEVAEPKEVKDEGEEK